MLWLRHLAGHARARGGRRRRRLRRARRRRAARAGDALPEFARADVTPGLLRAGILRDGCVLVRGLIDRDAALRFAERIDRAFAERERYARRRASRADGYYEEFEPHRSPRACSARDWIQEGGGVLAADSPTVAFEMFELFREAEPAPLVDGYLGEPGLISAHKTTLRKATPRVPGAWHQDGEFMGDVRSLNLWLSLSRCGDVAPGLDIVPRRLDHLVATQTDEAMLDYPGLAGQGRGGGRRQGDRPADLRARRRAVLRRDVPASDGVRSVDAEPPLRDRELVLRQLGVPGRVRAGRALVRQPDRPVLARPRALGRIARALGRAAARRAWTPPARGRWSRSARSPATSRACSSPGRRSTART